MGLAFNNFDRAVLGQRGWLRPGTYVTDGRDLFYVRQTLKPDDRGSLTELEDCRTLDVMLRSRDEQEKMRVWPVRFASESNL
jgi:hypothetical protein